MKSVVAPKGVFSTFRSSISKTFPTTSKSKSARVLGGISCMHGT